jgi:hypothetical protein
MTAKNGCTLAEAAAADAKLSDLIKDCPALLSTEEEKVVRRVREKINREARRQEALDDARTTLVTEVKRWRPNVRHAEACKLVNEALETLLHVKMKEKKTSRWRRPIWVAEQQ